MTQNTQTGPRPKLAATLLDSHGHVLSKGEADVPPDRVDVTFYPFAPEDLNNPPTNATILLLTGERQSTLELSSGRLCETSDGCHLHFQLIQ